MSEGHEAARQYPLAVLWSEARIVRQRHADRLKQQTVLMQMTIGSVMDKKAAKQLSKLIQRMDESD